MSNVKDLFENKELMDSIVDEIDDTSVEDAEVKYEVWAVAYDAENNPTDEDIFIHAFDNPHEALMFANKVNIETMNSLGIFLRENLEAKYFTIEIASAVNVCNDSEDEYVIVGSTAVRELWLDGEYGSEEDVPDFEEGFADNVVAIETKDYEILADGTLKVKRELLKDFNKNDSVAFQFVCEPQCSPITYKIVSKVEYKDGDYYHCDLVI